MSTTTYVFYGEMRKIFHDTPSYLELCNPWHIFTFLQVALGTCNQLLAADYAADKLPAGKHSVKGAGAIAPDPGDVHKT